MKKIIPIVFATNDNYIKPLLTSIVSILENKNKDTSYVFYILHSGISSDNIEKFNKFARKKNTDISFVNVFDYLQNINLDDYMRIDKNYDYITGETFYRFFMPSLFPQFDKVIYLDCDTIVTQDLSELFDIDLEGYYLGGVRDLYIMSQAEHILDWNYPTISTNQTFDVYLREVLNIQDLKYFNAGVLIFNLKEMRENNIEQKLLDFAQNNLHLEYQDQDILNAVCKKRIKQIPYKFNITNFPQHSKDLKKYNLEIQKDFKSKPVIIHYIGKFKPWTLSKFCNEAKVKRLGSWWFYYAKTPIFNILDIHILFHNLIVNYYQLQIKERLIKIYWIIIDFFIKVYWIIRNSIIKVYWKTRDIIIKTYWFFRTLIDKIYWKTRDIIIKTYWFLRTLIDKIYWKTRDIIIKTYWTIRRTCISIKRAIKKLFSIIKKIIKVIFKTILKFLKKCYKISQKYINKIVKTIFKYSKIFFNKIIKTITKHSKRFFNRIIKTAIKHTKRLINRQQG